MYYRIVKETYENHYESGSVVMYAVEYSKDRFYGWRTLYVDIYPNYQAHTYYYASVIKERLRANPDRLRWIDEKNNAGVKRTIIEYNRLSHV